MAIGSASCRSCSGVVCVEGKNPSINGPTQFKPVLFKGPLCFTILGALVNVVVFLISDSTYSLLICRIVIDINLVSCSPAVITY